MKNEKTSCSLKGKGKDTSDKEMVSKICKEFLKLSDTMNNVILKWDKDLNKYPTKEDIQMAKKRLKRHSKACSVHLCLFFCFAYRVIITIFLNSIYMR